MDFSPNKQKIVLPNELNISSVIIKLNYIHQDLEHGTILTFIIFSNLFFSFYLQILFLFYLNLYRCMTFSDHLS